MNFGNCRQVVSEIVVYGFLFIVHDEFRKLSSGRAFDDCLFCILQYVLYFYSTMQTIDNNSNNSGKGPVIIYGRGGRGIFSFLNF